MLIQIKMNGDNVMKEFEKEKDKENNSVSLKDKIRHALNYSIHTWIFKCFAIALIIEIVLEMLGRRSVFAGFKFVFTSPIVYLYNVSIIFFTFLFALFLRRRIFGMIIIGTIWLGCGIVNFIVLGYRVTPFAAIDFLMVADALSMLDVYFRKWQQVLLVILIIAVIAGLVVLFKKTPKFDGVRNVKGTMLLCVIAWCIVWTFTNFGVKHNIISDDFANLGMAYQDYGFAYCFANSIVDNGIDKPDSYSEESMSEIRDALDGIKASGRKKQPNIIMIQLESFFDPNDVEGLELSENPVPNFTKYKELYPSGYFTVPALGAGTANTEFEVLTGIKSSYFGAGEYPYKTTVNEVPVEGLCSILKREGYGTYAIHNNKASFYDREHVYDCMGFDSFISLEYMYNVEYTSTGWAKDASLVEDIMKCLKDTKGQDFVYTISVQGHGRYPDGEDTCEDHIQVEYTDEEMLQPIHYYVNQIYEMDAMLKELVSALDAYGEDYVLVLYGDHLPSLNLTEEQLTDSSLFQTEYVMINNIGLRIEDEDIEASELSVKLLKALNITPGYAQRAHMAYKDEELDDKLLLIAYDMMFGEMYMYDGISPVPDGDMKMGVDDIFISEVKNESSHIVVGGYNFNEYSVVYNGDVGLETIYIDKNTLMVNDIAAIKGDEFTVKQVDKSHHILSSSSVYIY